MPPVKPEDLEDDVRALLGKAVREGACPSEQPVCRPDARVTAQLTSEQTVSQILPWRMAQAEKGDLLLTPGGPAGFIGALLGVLDPPQYYSHMGIFVQDKTAIRHVTTSEEWLRRYSHKMGTKISEASHVFIPESIEEAPTNGFIEERLRHLWPGTITQSVEAAYLSARNEGAEADPFMMHETELNEDFRISALTFKPEPFPQPDGSTKLVWPTLVKQCKNSAFSQEQHAILRDATDRVVDAVSDLRSHYRFYAYTRAALEPENTGPLLEQEVPAGFAAGCTGRNARPKQLTARTVGAQCASLIWLAVQLANERAAAATPTKERIILDATTVDPEAFFTCPANNYITPTRVGANRTTGDDGARTLDGLYYYPPSEREKAGARLYEDLRASIEDEVVNSDALQASLDAATEGDVGKPLWVVLNIFYAGIPMVLLPAILGVTDSVFERLVLIFSDMPDDVANQMANAFANDDCSLDAADSDAWKKPGSGETVSPDNIARYWSPPVRVYPREEILGLWGRNIVAMPPLPPTQLREGPPPSSWQISTGFAHRRIYVKRSLAGVEQPVAGATVRIGCLRVISGRGGWISFGQVPSGLYWAEAWWDDPDTGVRWSSPGRVMKIEEGSVELAEFQLVPPPENLRCVVVHVHMGNVSRKAVGKDWWAHPDWTLQPFHMGVDLAPPVMEKNVGGAQDIDHWGNSEFSLDFKLLQPPGAGDPPLPPGVSPWSLEVNWRVRINEHGENDPWREEAKFIVPPTTDPLAPGTPVETDLKRLDVWPVRSSIRITILNLRA